MFSHMNIKIWAKSGKFLLNKILLQTFFGARLYNESKEQSQVKIYFSGRK